VLVWEWAGDAGALEDAGARMSERVLPTNTFWGSWGTYARGLAALLRGRHDEALEGARASLTLASTTGESRLIWRAGRVAWRAA
jgi:hypothetical protein